MGAPSDCRFLQAASCNGLSTFAVNPFSVIALHWTRPRASTQNSAPGSFRIAFASLRGSDTYKFSSPQEPHWSVSGAWLEKENVVLLTDLPTASIVHISLGNGLLRQVKASEISSSSPLTPRQLARRKTGGLLLQLIDGRFLWLNRHYEIVNKVVLDGIGNPAQGFISGIWDWCEAGSKIVALADIEMSPTDWHSGIVRIDPKNRSAFELIQPMELASQNRQYARLGFKRLACTNNGSYALLVDPEPGVYKIENGLSRLRDFPDGYSKPTILPKEFPGSDQMQTLYNQIEQSAAAVQLIGDHNNLYLTLRRRNGDGAGTIWRVAKINPKTETTFQIADLPTTTAGLLLFPGETWWTLAEKGATRGWLNQPTERIARIPTPFPSKRLKVTRSRTIQRQQAAR